MGAVLLLIVLPAALILLAVAVYIGFGKKGGER